MTSRTQYQPDHVPALADALLCARQSFGALASIDVAGLSSDEHRLISHHASSLRDVVDGIAELLRGATT